MEKRDKRGKRDISSLPGFKSEPIFAAQRANARLMENSSLYNHTKIKPNIMKQIASAKNQRKEKSEIFL